MEMTHKEAEERYAELDAQAGRLFLAGKLSECDRKLQEADRFWAEYRRQR